MITQQSGLSPHRNPVYLDYNASAPLRAPALEKMLQHLASVGNASSTHLFGQAAHEAVAEARRQVASLLGCSPSELIITSGATEANNLALHLSRGAGVIVTSAAEHPAVLEAAVAAGPGSHAIVDVDGDGRLDLASLRQALARADVGLVSVMAANNETGVLSDVSAVVDLAHKAGALVHTDATQLVGRLPVDLRVLDVDMLSLSAHKFGGPQGVGALFVRRSVAIPQRPLLVGGGHERGWRAGTTNVAGVVGMGAAAAECAGSMTAEMGRVRALRDRLEAALLDSHPEAWVNGRTADRLPGTSSVTFPGAPADAVMTAMPGIAVSNGSACHAGAPSPSHVLIAMGLDRADADSTLRFSLGYATTETDIDCAIEATTQAVGRIRQLTAPDQRPEPARA